MPFFLSSFSQPPQTTVCVLSAASLGTFPAALVVATLTAAVALSIFQRIRTEQRKSEEKEFSCSVEDLTKQLEALVNKENIPPSKEDNIELVPFLKAPTDLLNSLASLTKELEKIKKIVSKKLESTPIDISSQKSKIYEYINTFDVNNLKEQLTYGRKSPLGMFLTA